jgi:hypothetical protein
MNITRVALPAALRTAWRLAASPLTWLEIWVGVVGIIAALWRAGGGDRRAPAPGAWAAGAVNLATR